MGFPGGSDGKESACNAGNLGLMFGSERSPGEGNGNPFQYSCLENSIDTGGCLKTNKQTKKQTERRFFLFCSVKGHLSFISPRSMSNARFIKQKATPLFILASPWAQTCRRRQARGTQEPDRTLYHHPLQHWSLPFIHSYSPHS